MFTKERNDVLAAELLAYRSKQPRYATECASDGLFGWADFEDLLGLHATTGPSGGGVRVMLNGAVVPLTEYVRFITTPVAYECRVDRRALDQLYQSGATILLHRIDRINGRLSALCREVERITGRLAHIQCFAACKDIPSHNEPHADPSDSYVLQIAGRKHWRIQGCAQQVDLKAGQALFIPEGWPHQVHPMGEPSLHLTMNVSMRVLV